MPDLGFYIHLPFCLSRCGYCDFAVVTEKDDAQEEYIRRLENEIAFWGGRTGESPVSLYFGGGTPSRLGPDLWSRLMARLRESFRIDPDAEITCEANPESASKEVLDLWRELGVNRISLGVQTFNPQFLRDLDRRHDPQGACDAITRVRGAGFENWSLDLIYGLPGQTLDEWRRDLEQALSLDPPHLSFYNLILHPGLPTTLKALRSETPDSEEVQSEMFLLAVQVLESKGYEVYELSNAAMPGRRCRHNLLYWRGGDWLGLGLSAASHWEGMDFCNPKSWEAYLKTWESFPTQLPVKAGSGKRESMLLDFVMLRLRTAEGFALQSLEDEVGGSVPGALGQLLSEMRKQGYTRSDEGRVALSPKGWLVHSEIVARIMDCLG